MTLSTQTFNYRVFLTSQKLVIKKFIQTRREKEKRQRPCF